MKLSKIPKDMLNIFVHFIGPNPSTSFNPCSICPTVDSSAFIGPFSSVIGDITIKENVFIASNVSIRADEGTPFYIGANTNIQDGVILHGLKNGRVISNGRKYSIYIGEGVSCAHGCLVHGPCKIKDNAFVGFNAIVFNCIIGEGAYISPNAVVTGGVRLPDNRFVPLGAVIDTQQEADALPTLTEAQQEFTRDVQNVNREFPLSYSVLFGSTRCSCGLACNTNNLLNQEY
ncbi:carbonate dehydratase [Clostridium swellfunianum]|uniref:carbonate dehydratase n=1 Tax=Clostridium swellfunianum TaxID=1367462 RepID=UPI00202E2D55|nr:carbonate dehydratase [Clostridium swellfunianum]MCM0649130.1 carbonate dehydratase [Clostridium swellfunianum]